MNIREHINSYFPNILFFDAPVTDESIAGLSLINDNGPAWAVTYDEDKTMNDLLPIFEDSEDPYQSAVNWFDSNVMSSYMGAETPLFINQTFNHAVRYNKIYESILRMKDFQNMQEALELIDNNDEVIYFVSLEELDKLIHLA
jgi:hypothetical protein